MSNLESDFQSNDDAPDATPIDSADEVESEEWDDTPTAMQFRALFTLLAGGFLLWSQLRAPISASSEWNRFVAASVVYNLVLPLGIVWLFFAQGITHVSWLRNQALNAWNYGWNFHDWKRHLKWTLGIFAAMLPLLWLASRDTMTRDYYASYFPQGNINVLWLLISIAIYMFCCEWFFRGFLLFGIAQGVGPIVAIILQAILFGWAHHGKPPLEFYSSCIGGLLLGAIAWRQKSFAVAFYVHALLQIAWALLVR